MLILIIRMKNKEAKEILVNVTDRLLEPFQKKCGFFLCRQNRKHGRKMYYCWIYDFLRWSAHCHPCFWSRWRDKKLRENSELFFWSSIGSIVEQIRIGIRQSDKINSKVRKQIKLLLNLLFSVLMLHWFNAQPCASFLSRWRANQEAEEKRYQWLRTKQYGMHAWEMLMLTNKQTKLSQKNWRDVDLVKYRCSWTII